MRVVMRQVVFDRQLQCTDVLKGPAANALRRDVGEESLHLIEPTRARRRGVQMIPRVANKPAGHFRHLMGSVVVHDDVHVAGRRQLRLEALQESQKLLMPVRR